MNVQKEIRSHLFSAYKVVLSVLLIAGGLVLGACSKDGTERQAEQRNAVQAQNGGQSASAAGLIGFIKTQKLVNYQSRTIGTAFETYKYFTKKEWREEALKSGQFAVVFLGWVDPRSLNESDGTGTAPKGLEVRFIVESNGSFYALMTSVVEKGTDGRIYRSRVLDTTTTLTSIYANEKLKL